MHEIYPNLLFTQKTELKSLRVIKPMSSAAHYKLNAHKS